MATNPRITSLQRFKKLTEELQAEVRREAIAELNTQATELARLIESIAPVAPVEGGELRTSVNVVPDRKSDMIVRIVAGGRLTRVPAARGVYDYARAVEFGTVNMKAKPFFFPTYRLRKKKIRSTMKRRLTKSIKKRSAV